MRPSYRALKALSPERKYTLGFIGLGRMGFEMANNLFTKTAVRLRKDAAPPSFIICDANAESARVFADSFKNRFPEYSIRVASTPAQVALEARTFLTMLPSSPHVQEVYISGKNNILSILESLPKGHDTLCIDSTTLDVQVAKNVANQVVKTGAKMVDAPVSGGVAGAKAGTLSFLVGGPSDCVAEAQPLLTHMGSRVIHCGPSGSGLAAKICNNLVLGVSQIVVAEAMLLGQKMGLSPSLLAGVINSSTGRCWPSETNNPVPSALPDKSPPCERDYEGGFATSLMLKDMDLALQAASTFGSALPLGVSAKELYEKVSEQKELAGKDFSVVYRHLEQLSRTQR